MATPRVTQQYIEVIRGDTARANPNARVTQQAVEHVRGDTLRVSPAARVTQQYIEVIRSQQFLVQPPPRPLRLRARPKRVKKRIVHRRRLSPIFVVAAVEYFSPPKRKKKRTKPKKLHTRFALTARFPFITRRGRRRVVFFK